MRRLVSHDHHAVISALTSFAELQTPPQGATVRVHVNIAAHSLRQNLPAQPWVRSYTCRTSLHWCDHWGTQCTRRQRSKRRCLGFECLSNPSLCTSPFGSWSLCRHTFQMLMHLFAGTCSWHGKWIRTLKVQGSCTRCRCMGHYPERCRMSTLLSQSATADRLRYTPHSKSLASEGSSLRCMRYWYIVFSYSSWQSPLPFPMWWRHEDCRFPTPCSRLQFYLQHCSLQLRISVHAIGPPV